MKPIRLILFSVGLAVWLNGFAFGQLVRASDDTFVSVKKPRVNFGASDILLLDARTTVYLKFDLSGIPHQTMSRATLRLYIDKVVEAGQFDVYSLPAAPRWSEKTLRYKTPPPALGATATHGMPTTVSTAIASRFLSIDVTAIVHGWLANPASNNGLALALTGTMGWFSFASKESGDGSHGPGLEIVFDEPEQASAGPLISEPLGIHIKSQCGTPCDGKCVNLEDDPDDCGGCGIVCTSGQTCNEGTCVCSNGQPVCSSGACETTHSDGVGQNFYDCNPLGTYTASEAIEAGTAYELSVGGSASNVSNGWECPGSNLISVCATNSSGNAVYCWGYQGSQAGQVGSGSCPWTAISTWN